MRNIIEILGQLETKGPMKDWYESRIPRRYPNGGEVAWQDALKRFLTATMDEVRLQQASRLARLTLELPAFGEVIPFRETVLRREAGSDISYEKQRDHSAHTVNNWLLGWLIYEQSERFRHAMDAATDRRGLCKNGLGRKPWEAFGDVWTYASILHDIGYLFEGGIPRIAWETSHERARRGALVVNDFFNHRIWHEWRITSGADRELIRRSGYQFLCLPVDGSLGGLVDTLPRFGGLKPLLHDVSTSVDRANAIPLREHINAFELWQAHYEHFGSPSMVQRVKDTQLAFAELAYQGLPKVGARVLDHGIASGLLLLQLITMYYGLRSALADQDSAWVNAQDRQNFMGPAGGVDYRPQFWWSGILWGTFATAVHNVQQTMAKEKLALNDDPLAYLGILVDTLQEWDRYTVERGSVLAHEAALQGIDVGANLDAGVLQLSMPKKRTEKAIEDLDKALIDWKEFVVIVPR